MSLHVQIWLCAFDGRPPAFHEFPVARACDVDGPFLRVTDAGGDRFWYPVNTVVRVSATPSEGDSK